MPLDGDPPGAAAGIDTTERGEGTVTEPRLYQLIRQRPPVVDRTFEITFHDPGVHAYGFRFSWLPTIQEESGVSVNA